MQGGAIEGIVVLSLPELLSLASGGAGAQAAAGVQAGGVRFVRVGDDLVIEAGAKTVVVEGYFAASPPPTLTLGSGGQLSPSLVASFLEQGGDFPQKYALGWLQGKFGMTDDNGGMQVIGKIVSTEGQVWVVRDGLVIRLEAGDIVLEGDIISTGEGAEVFMRFTDKMEFRLGEDARLAIDQYLYDDVSSSGLQVLSIIAGAFSYASGLLAGASPISVRLQTPHGVIGIRGTKILGEVGDGELVVTVLEGRVALLQEGREVAILDEPFETLRIDSANGAANGALSGASGIRTEIASVAEVLELYDFLDGSEQQLRALGAGDRLEDEPIENETGGETGTGTATDAGEVVEVALLSGGDETYIVAPVAEDEGGSFIDVEGEAVAAADLVEDLGAGEVEEKIVIEPDPQSPYLDSSLPAGELSFEGSSVGVMFDFSSGDGVFDDVADLVFRHGADVGVVQGASKFVASGVVDATGGEGDDILTGDGNRNTLAGGEGNDRLDGGAGADTLEGGAGADTVYGDAGDDIIRGGADSDTLLDGGAGSDTIYGDAGDDTIRGGDDGDTLYGGAGEDELYGGGGIDTLRGGAEADTLYGGGADDFLEGGDGADTYVFESGSGADTIREDTDGGKLYFRSATGLADIVFSRDADDNVVITLGSDSVVILAAAYAEGRYSIHYGSGDTALGRLSLGTTGDDPLLTGTDGADLLLGLGGVDILRGGDGADTLDGGAGNDRPLRAARARTPSTAVLG